MRKPDSLAQMAHCEGAFSEKPDTSRGISRWAASAATANVAGTDRDPGIRSEGGTPGSSQVGWLPLPEMPAQILLRKPRPDHRQRDNTRQERSESQRHVIDGDMDEGVPSAGDDENPRQ